MALTLFILNIYAIFFVTSLFLISELATFVRILFIERGNLKGYLGERYRPGSDKRSAWDIMSFIFDLGTLLLVTFMFLSVLFFSLGLVLYAETASIIFKSLVAILICVFISSLFIDHRQILTLSMSRSFISFKMEATRVRLEMRWQKESFGEKYYHKLWWVIIKLLQILPITILIATIFLFIKF